MAYIPGVSGASLEVNRNYSYNTPEKINSLRQRLNSQDKFKLEQQTNTFNARLQHQMGKGRRVNTGQKPDFDAFLKLLTEQLKHQDPLKPMEDKDFIAQMAQFSSLGEMTKFNKSMAKLLKNKNQESQFNLLERKVYWYQNVGNHKETHIGTVKAISVNDGNYEVIVNSNGRDTSVPVEKIFRVEVDSNKKNQKKLTKPAPVSRKTVKRKTASKNIIPSSKAGFRAEFHNRLNTTLNSHIMNNK